VLINGEPATQLSVLDRGFQYGDGLFETIAVSDGRPCLWDRHLNRLQLGCQRLAIPFPDPDLLLDEALQACAGEARSVLKIMLTRGEGGRGYRPAAHPEPNRIVYCTPWPEHPPKASEEGIVARICETRLGQDETLAGIKHLNRLPQIMARKEWDDPAITEGLMLDRDGYVIEGTISNLFLVRDGELITPDLSRCGVAGVMRELVLDSAARLGIPSRIRQIHVDELQQAEALFLTNSLIGIWPIRQLGEQNYRIDALDVRLRQEVQQLGFAPQGNNG
jgi:4-amino-4-deoxychorismate lyase